MVTATIEHIASATGFSHDELEAMVLLDKSMKKDPKTKILNALTDDEKAKICTFLEKALSFNSMDVNKKIMLLDRERSLDIGISSATVFYLKMLTYKVRKWPEISEKMPEITHHFNKAHVSGQRLDEAEKISLAELGTLFDLSKSYDYLKVFQEVNLLDQNNFLMTLYQAAVDAKNIVQILERDFSAQFNISPASVLWEDNTAKRALAGKSMNWYDRLIAKNGSHAALVYKTEAGQPSIAHVNPRYQNNNFTLYEFLYNDVYNLKLSALIKPETQEYLRTNLGENWLSQLEKDFGNIQREMHDSKIAPMEVTRRMNRHNANMTDLYGQWRYASIPLTVQHKNLVTRDHSDEKITKKMFAREKYAAEDDNKIRVLCSEFVGMCLIASVHELNDRLKQTLQARGCHNIPDTLIRSPLSEREHLRTLSPTRLVTVLSKEGILERAPVSEKLASIVKQKEMKLMLAQERIERVGGLDVEEHNNLQSVPK